MRARLTLPAGRGIAVVMVRPFPLLAALCLAGAGPVAAAAPVLTLEGAGPSFVRLDMAALAALPRRTAARQDHGRPIACEGPALIDVLANAGLPTGERVSGEALATVVVAVARDGYRAVFTLGELDRSLGDAGIIVAVRCDGRPLDAEAGPLRLVAPADRRGARSVRQLERLVVTVPARR